MLTAVKTENHRTSVNVSQYLLFIKKKKHTLVETPGQDANFKFIFTLEAYEGKGKKSLQTKRLNAFELIEEFFLINQM